uniref:CASC1 C-terminal domain-containing protein n=1 Tax=Glossina austeni TaxID=7395 RepID=A0A1A9VTK6_GLOAU
MANDKKKKEEKTKPAPQKHYDTLTVEEVKANELKYTQRLMELRACLILIDDALKDEIKKNDLQLLLEKWVAYITCDPLPKPYVPPNIRTFYAKAQDFEQALLERNIDWNLHIDERSILTQNIFREDRTRTTLMRAASNELIVSYDKYINDSLQILHKIEYYLANDKETMKAKSEVLLDIIEVKEAIQKEITDAFDRLTYKILCTEQANMISLDAVTTEYTYKCENFRIHIWGLKNVPIRFTHIAEPRMVAHLHNLDIVLQIPISVLRPQLTIQGIHMNFDHITEYAKTAKQEFFIPLAHLNAGIQDLPECLANEFKMQLDIQKRVRDQIMETYKEYMEKLALLKESQEALLKQRKTQDNKGKTPKPVKPLREPQFLRDDEYPEIFYEFLDEEGKQYNSFMNVVYNPANLNLSSDEINLKKFFILGGIFHLNFVERPTHYDLKDFNMTWHTPNKQLLRDKDCVISLLRPVSIRKSSMVIRLSEPKQSLSPKVEALKDEVDAANPWFVLTFSLPEYLCSWGEPIACHYTTVETMAEVDQEEQTIQAQVDNLLNIKKMPDTSEFAMDTIGDRVQAAKNMSIRHSNMNFFSTSSAQRRATIAEQYSIERTDGIFHKKDFALNNPYTVRQLRYLEQHCAPQILSSYKFPKEINEEALHNAPKGKGGILFKKAKSVVAQSIRSFTYNEMQNNPERLFPIFKKEKPLYITNHLHTFRGSLSNEPKTFYQLVKAIILIKRLAQNAVTQIMQLPPYESPVHLEKFKKLKTEVEEKKKKKKSTLTSMGSSKSFLLGSSQSKVGASFREPVRRKSREVDRETLKSVRSQAEVSFRDSEDYNEEEEASISLEIITDGGMKHTKLIRYNHWTTQHIRRQTFLREERKYVIETDRLGYIGFACKRYEHFPFKFWSLQPNEANENEVIFTLETQYVKCVLFISGEGIHGYATEPSKRFVRDPKMYLSIKKPINDFKELRKRFREKNLNIFADHDAGFYIENGNFSEKHLAMEMHTYCCMALHCTDMIYTYSKWNGLAKRRDIILHYIHYKDNPENTVLIHVTPEETTFVEVSELCSDTVDEVLLAYTPTWRNVNVTLDLPLTATNIFLSNIGICNLTKQITQYVKCVLQVSGQGVRGYVTDYIHGEQYLANPKMYLIIDKPIKDYKELKRIFKEKNLNIFPDNDASFYIENGYFCEKHLPMELHTYNCMTVHCSEMKFTHSQWNRLAKRRDIILQTVQWKDNPDNTVLMHITPEETTFVEVKEMCTEKRDEVNLSYTSTWRNINKQRKQFAQKQNKQAAPERRSRTGRVSKTHHITKVYTLLTSEENKTRNERCISRLNELKLISNIMNESTRRVEKVNKLQTILDQFTKYANCEKIPEHYPTNIIRTFYFRDRFRENECVFESMRRNWPHYDCNILSQNISQRRKENNLQKNILAPHYDKSIDDKLKILHNIDKFLDDESETAKVTIEQLQNITDVRIVTEQEICDVFDRFTYRIISAENIYMKSQMLKDPNPNRPIQPFRSKEPQTCADDQYPDVINEFLEEEHNQYLDFINVMYNPQALDLKSDEINLKKFHILGGIYQLNLVKKPKQINFFQNSNMIWHCEGQNLVVEKDFRVDEFSTIPPETLSYFTRLERMTNVSVIKLGQSKKSAHILDEPLETQEAEPSNPWFVLTFHLPDYLCCWGSPMACHYESVDEVLPVEKIANSRENMIKSLVRLNDDETAAPIEKSPEQRQTMELQDVLRKKRQPFPSSLASFPSISRLYNTVSLNIANGHPALHSVRDFNLNSITLSEFHNMQRYCVPLLLPSYQFPKERKLEMQHAHKQTAKKFIGLSVHSHHSPNSLERDNELSRSHIFDQNLKNPERLFAIYDEVKPVFTVKPLHNIDYDDSAQSEPKTFYQLIKALMAMKKVIQNQVNKLMSVTPHTTTKSSVNIIKTKLQKKILTFESKYNGTTSPVVKSMSLKKFGSLRVLSSSRQLLKSESVMNVASDVKDDSSSDLSSNATITTTISTASKDAKETK